MTALFGTTEQGKGDVSSDRPRPRGNGHGGGVTIRPSCQKMPLTVEFGPGSPHGVLGTGRVCRAALPLGPRDRTGEQLPTQRGDRIFEGSDSWADRKSTRLNSSHVASSYAVFCLKKKTTRRQSQAS